MRMFFARDLWSRELASLPTFRRWGYGIARVLHLTVTNFVKDRCTWRASALTYITVLSLVPMLALAFSVAKGMGAYQKLLDDAIVPFLDTTFGPADGKPTELEELGLVEDGAEGGEDTSIADAVETLEAEDAEAAGAATDADVAAGGAEESVSEEAGPEELAPADGTTEPAELDEFEEQGGSEVRRAIDTVLGFVQKTDVSKLGVLGFFIVIYTVIKLLGAIELSFNDIWGVRKARSLPRKVADYFSTVVLVPLLLVTGTGVLSVARSGWLAQYTGRGESKLFAALSSMGVVWLGFAFAYLLMPNTRTRVKSAIIGGIVGGTMWQLFQWVHLELQVGVANYNAIYSTFAALPIFLFWVQSSWVTVLLGAEAAAAHQNHARHGQLVRSRDFDLALKETVALRLAVRVTRSFLGGAPPVPSDELAEELGCPERTLEEVAASLEKSRIVATVELDEEEPCLVLATDPDRVRMQDIFDALKGPIQLDGSLKEMHVFEGGDEAIGRAFQRFRDSRGASPQNLTLRELTEQE